MDTGDPQLTYLLARAAAMEGDHDHAAELLATLADAEPSQAQFAQQALTEAIDAGRMDLASSLVSRVPASNLSSDARLLIVAQAVKLHRADRALQWLTASGGTTDLSAFTPLISAWDAAERGDQSTALSSLAPITGRSLLAPFLDEEKALILLKFHRTAEAEPYARRAIGTADTREAQVRLELADGFLAAGDRTRAAAMVDGIGGDAEVARQHILAGRPSGKGIDSGAKALSSVLTAFAGQIAHVQRGSLPVGLVQVARFADPQNSSATALLSLLLSNEGRSDEALALLKAVPADDALISQIRDVQVRILVDNKRLPEAYSIAASATQGPLASLSDYSRLGDVLEAMDRHDAAADAFARAAAIAKARNSTNEVWPLQLLQASALEEAKRWPEAKAVLQQAMAIAPDQPLLLNFMGYAKLEHGEDVEAAEAMVRKAAELAPDDASIIDSLGWAEYKRGKIDDAIATLEQAAAKDPDEAEIQEHLGDALYKSGRRVEARFAWNAALVTAGDDIAGRVKAKLASGLTDGNAAP